MLKYTALVKSVIVCFIILSLCGCTSDDPLLAEGGSNNVFNSDVAYLAISLTSDGEPMLINSGDDDDVKNAHFYFYDSEGAFVTRGAINFDTNSSSNILVILTNLTGKEYPKYVVTVLNEPDGFEYTTNLAGMQEIKTTEGSSPIYDNDSSIVMSNSTYNDTGRTYNFVTEIGDKAFVEGQVPDDLSNVTATLSIPIERLAAKVTVETGNELTVTEITDSVDATHNVYSISNDRYVELLGWKINAVARKSYVFKNVDESWNDSNPWSGWNSATDYRCYWAKSFNYGLTDSAYPESNIKEGNDKANTPTEEASSGTWLNDYLEYVNLKDGLISISGSGYCPENTNTVGEDSIIQDAKSSAITSVLIKARAWTQKAKTNNDDETDDNANEVEYVPDSLVGTGGLMYYNIPIKHVNQPNPDEDILIEGEYGVVRSYHYTITINSISSLGTPIIDEDEVIVPTNTDYNLSFTISSLPWKLHEETVDYSGRLNNDYIDVTGGDSEVTVDATPESLWSVTEIDFTVPE